MVHIKQISQTLGQLIKTKLKFNSLNIRHLKPSAGHSRSKTYETIDFYGLILF